MIFLIGPFIFMFALLAIISTLAVKPATDDNTFYAGSSRSYRSIGNIRQGRGYNNSRYNSYNSWHGAGYNWFPTKHWRRRKLLSKFRSMMSNPTIKYGSLSNYGRDNRYLYGIKKPVVQYAPTWNYDNSFTPFPYFWQNPYYTDYYGYNHEHDHSHYNDHSHNDDVEDDHEHSSEPPEYNNWEGPHTSSMPSSATYAPL